MERVSYTEGYSDKSVLKQIYDLKRSKQNVLIAGDNIVIRDDVISAIGGGMGYIAGEGIIISDGVISTPVGYTNVEIIER